ncbi:hypothetical protein SLEP1_g44468 [Rubroshorea leprosula]|uniref:XS domain-containing protein n=1 Tax=Rubroshorea leprosula TaxID=152421 RepID=A0AAV5LHE1_9ROSI|nr:hypothetical protein SLEP1_g44468 [Rubroshorea leprosula]
MGSQELLEHSYVAHFIWPKRALGYEFFIFESSVVGYLEAVRLHKLLKEQRKDRDAWD